MLRIEHAGRKASGREPIPPRIDAWWTFITARFLTRKFCSFVFIGLICTLLYLAIYRISRISLQPLAANGIALVLTASPNFFANRTLTFHARNGSVPRQAGQYAVFYVLGICASSVALAIFLSVWADPPRAVEYLAALGSIGFATVIRYVAMSNWVFPASRRLSRALPPTAEAVQVISKAIPPPPAT